MLNNSFTDSGGRSTLILYLRKSGDITVQNTLALKKLT